MKICGFELRISKSRKTKLGDFRPAHASKPPRISVNGDLGQYHFLITYTHEVAHALCWDRHGRKVAPHGQEWKDIYKELLQELIELKIFPSTIEEDLNSHLQRPKASSCSDPTLYKKLNRFEKGEEIVFLDELEEGATFLIKGDKKFVKGKKRRSRYECKNLQNSRLYYVSGHAEVVLIK